MDSRVKATRRLLPQVKDDHRSDFDEERGLDEYYKKLRGDVEEQIDGRKNVVLSRLFVDDRRYNVKRFCRCAGCDVVPAIPKNYAYCCKEVLSVSVREKSFAIALAEKIGTLKCITHHPSFKALCLNTEALDLISTHGGVFPSFAPGEGDDRKNQDYRYMAYRSFNKWVHNKHTIGNRIEIPLCALKKIMERFPVQPAERVPNFPGLLTIFGVSFFENYRDEEKMWMANILGNEDGSELLESSDDEEENESWTENNEFSDYDDEVHRSS